ncbi:efflux RND transporter periplasmic adaptor subunit [Clostridium sp. AWRP]|uniref:efflux RND transporter periplasmic adaptor subunit n=1 Tax=Clostridium sp. AWRP TaxID=2212991 RepID=UPI000FD6D223|nr:efflux RND transporter periplasmic adaptor subunit [Clostridium sp. AWRP]AZV56731.1 efflux RND transporter periplasmic adaptor subunit [Clostridium sp. AWRP]
MKLKLNFVKDKKKLAIIVAVIFIITAIGISSYVKSRKSQGKKVTISKVIKRNIVQSTTVSGSIEPKYSNDITLNNTQKVAKVLVTEGQQVTKGDILVQMDTSDYDSELKKLKIDLKNAQNAVSQSQAVPGASKDNTGNQTDSIKAEIDNLNAKIEQSNIRANIDGRVMRVDAKENQVPKAGDMVIVDDISQYKVSIAMSQYDAMKVAKGQKAIVKIKGNDQKKYTGSVTDVGQIAQVKADAKATGQEAKVNVIVTLDKADDSIKVGYEADAEIVFNEKRNVVCMGFDSVKEEKGTKKKYVYIVNSKNKVSKRYISTGIETDDYMEVIDGLNEGEKYVSNPPDTLKNGDIVETQAGGNNK